MPATSSSDLREALMAFFEGLPSSIKKDVVALVLAYAFHDAPVSTSADFHAILKAKMNRSWPKGAVGAVISVAAVTDYVLDNFVLDAGKQKAAIERAAQTDPAFEAVRLESDVREREFRNARSDFDALKDSVLTFRAIREFEG